MRRGYRRPPFLTIGVCCSWLHSVNSHVSIRVLVSVFFVCGWLLHISADSCMSLRFAVNSLRVRRRWQSANLIAKMFQKCIKHAAKIHTNSFRIHPKSTKMMPRSAPKATLGASRFHELPPNKFLVPFWSNLGDLARHFMPSWAPRGSQNQAFWHQVALKSQKMTSWMRH